MHSCQFLGLTVILKPLVKCDFPQLLVQDNEDDAVTQFANLLDTLEENLLDSLTNAIDNQEAQDRILLEDVQVS